MAETTTAITACDIRIWLDNAAGVQKDISGSSNQISANFDLELGAFRVFGGRWMKRLEGGKDASFALQIVYTTAADEGYDLLKQWYFAASPGDRTLTLYVPDKDVGSDVYECEAKIDNFAFPLNAGSAEPVIVTLNLLPNGEVTHSTSAT